MATKYIIRCVSCYRKDLVGMYLLSNKCHEGPVLTNNRHEARSFDSRSFAEETAALVNMGPQKMKVIRK